MGKCYTYWELHPTGKAWPLSALSRPPSPTRGPRPCCWYGKRSEGCSRELCEATNGMETDHLRAISTRRSSGLLTHC
eukprot:7331636-Prymnesium_polylepis.1